jgi:hypothetical protein
VRPTIGRSQGDGRKTCKVDAAKPDFEQGDTIASSIPSPLRARAVVSVPMAGHIICINEVCQQSPTERLGKFGDSDRHSKKPRLFFPKCGPPAISSGRQGLPALQNVGQAASNNLRGILIVNSCGCKPVLRQQLRMAHIRPHRIF